MKQEVETWEGEDRKWGASRALTYDGDILHMRDGDELVGVANVSREPFATTGPWAGMYEANYLGTKRPGYGREMVRNIKDYVVSKGGRGYFAYFNEEALGFHLATGMKLLEEGDRRMVYWMAEWEA